MRGRGQPGLLNVLVATLAELRPERHAMHCGDAAVVPARVPLAPRRVRCWYSGMTLNGLPTFTKVQGIKLGHIRPGRRKPNGRTLTIGQPHGGRKLNPSVVPRNQERRGQLVQGKSLPPARQPRELLASALRVPTTGTARASNPIKFVPQVMKGSSLGREMLPSARRWGPRVQNPTFARSGAAPNTAGSECARHRRLPGTRPEMPARGWFALG